MAGGWLPDLLLSLPLVCGAPLQAATVVPPAQALVDALIGDWAGTALRTPRGVLPYDICFEKTSPGRVTGVADPGAALHHWDFRLQGDALKLRFLTTFMGNTTPTWLTVEDAAGEPVWFQTDELDHLRVGIEKQPDQFDIHVRLHDRPHVHIRLTRRAPDCTAEEIPDRGRSARDHR